MEMNPEIIGIISYLSNKIRKKKKLCMHRPIKIVHGDFPMELSTFVFRNMMFGAGAVNISKCIVNGKETGTFERPLLFVYR